MKIMPFLFLSCFGLAKTTADFEGEYTLRHSLYVTSENRTVHNIEDFVRIQPVDEKKANILIDTYTQNFHSCQLVGQAVLKNDVLIFKSAINKKMNRGRAATCLLKISQSKDSKDESFITIEDNQGNCRLRYCGMSAQLDGKFKRKSVLIRDKN